MGSQDNPVSLILRVLEKRGGQRDRRRPGDSHRGQPDALPRRNPGDMPALVKATITDNSTGHVLHKLHVG